MEFLFSKKENLLKNLSSLFLLFALFLFFFFDVIGFSNVGNPGINFICSIPLDIFEIQHYLICFFPFLL